MSGSKIVFDSCTHTTDELRDWHATQDGWEMIRGSWARTRLDKPQKEWNVNHPYPATLDGAASAMPQGWHYLKTRSPMAQRAYCFAENDIAKVTIISTDDEIHDRYLLAKMVREHIMNRTATQGNQMSNTNNNEYRYEKRPVRVRAIQAEFEMCIKHPHGLNGYVTVEPGQWIVEPEGEMIEIVSDEEFRKNYRIIRPDVSIRSSSAVGSDGRNEW